MLTPEASLKFRLLTDGVRVHPAASVDWQERFDGPLTLAEYATTSGVGLVVGNELYVNAPLSTAENLPELRSSPDAGFYLAVDGEAIPVSPIPVPSFHDDAQVDRQDGSLQPHINYGVTHTDRCRVSPISGCAWRCHFCDLPYTTEYFRKHQDNLLDTIRIAEHDPLSPARHVLISGGTPRAPMPDRPGRIGRDDETWIDGVYAHLAEHSPVPVDVMMPARDDLGYPAWLRSIGVNMLSVNLEVSDPGRARALAAAKHRYGRDRFLDYVEAAVNAFEIGFVQSLVVYGEAIEPLESTLRGIEDLLERGCIPVLSPFRPHPATPMRTARAATYDETVWLYQRTLDACDRLDTWIRPGPRCIPCHHNTAAVPDGSAFYIGLEGDLTARGCPAY